MPRPAPGSPSDLRLLWACALFAALLPILFHLPYVSGERLLYEADTAQLQYPRYKILCDALQQEGGLPLWQNWLYGGSPFHANPENPTLYPPVLLLASCCSALWTINLTILLHLSAAALGMFFLVRRLWSQLAPSEDARALAPGGALLAACLFSLSLWTRSDHLNLVAYGATHALIPWVLLAADSVLNGARPRRAAGLLGLLLAMQVLSGGLYVIPYAALALAAWMICLGLLGGRERARRALIHGGLAALLAALIVAGKYLPYREWISTTNRADTLSYAEAVGKTLGGLGQFSWAEVWKLVSMYTLYGGVVLLALLALPLLRAPAVRLGFGLLLLFFATALGGPVHRWLYAVVPLFDQTRNAVRAWSGVNAMLPLLAGLGICFWLSRSARARARPAWCALGCAAIALLLAPLLSYSFRFEKALKHPARFDELLSRYVQWPLAAERCGSEWRAMSVDRTEPDGRNEQFVSTALEVETPAGYLGHVWPRELEHHVYGPPAARLDDVVRLRRRSTLSVRWMITQVNDPSLPRAATNILPQNIDGNLLLENPLARPRAFEPAVVVAVYGDSGSKASYALLDDGHFPLQAAACLQLSPARELSDPELDALDALILRGPASAAARRAAEGLQARGKPVREVGAQLSPADRVSLAGMLLGLEQQASRSAAGVGSFVRRDSATVRVERSQAARGRWLVLSEPWAIYTGWSASSDSGATLALERADGISSAVFVPAGESAFTARYAPRSVAIGLACYLLGAIAALLCALWPEAARSRP